MGLTHTVSLNDEIYIDMHKKILIQKPMTINESSFTQQASLLQFLHPIFSVFKIRPHVYEQITTAFSFPDFKQRT